MLKSKINIFNRENNNKIVKVEMRKIMLFVTVSLGISMTSCDESSINNIEKNKVINDSELAFNEAPEWSQNAIWYQIFVERFRNGDKNNDPTLKDIKSSYPNKFPENWKITPWEHQWYKLNSWEKEFYGDDFYTAIQSRRYGGDLQGVLDKLDYLQELGITAIYFNPLNDAPSMHKFDATNYTHIDHTFGPDPEGDLEIMKNEDPLDPSTWKWTSADKLFLKVIEEAHKRNIKVVLDYSWNHTGIEHQFWKDILKNQEKSRFKDFYMIKSFDNPETVENEFEYEGWAGVAGMPELKKVNVVNRVHGHPYEGNIHPKVKEYIFNVSKRWLDPMNNGDFSKGLDGYRLDVADQIPMGFWRDYRKFVRSVNPETYLIGEIWWASWPDTLMDPKPYTKGDIFDAVMHYQFYKPARRFFANTSGGYSPSEYVKEIENVFAGYKPYTKRAMMNMSSSHDAPRLSTSFYNKNTYKYKVKQSDDKNYKINRPNELTWKEVKQFLVHQFTFIGSPQIWQGDEMGMWGGDDPDDRKPLIWDDYSFENEKIDAFGTEYPSDEVKLDKPLLEFYKKLITIRKNNSALIYGDINYEKIDDENNIFAYSRNFEGNTVIVIFNMSTNIRNLDLKVEKSGLYIDLISNNKFNVSTETLTLSLEGKSSLILKLVEK